MEPSTSLDFLDDCGNYERGFANLPMEIILKIYRYLNFYDIQASSLTCRRWLEASQSNEFQSKVLLKFSKPYLDDNSMPGEIFVRTQRDYRNLYLDEAVYGSLKGFFQTLSKTVEKLTIVSNDITNTQFYAIVKQLPNVIDLTIENSSSLFIAGQFLKTQEELDSMQYWLCGIKNLAIRKNRYLSDAILLRITNLIHGIEKLDLCGCHIAYHTSIQRRFYPTHLENTPSELILTFKFVLKVIGQHASTINELDLSYTLVGGSTLSSLVSIVGLNLIKVKFNFCRQLNLNGINTLTNFQKNIVELHISNSDGITDSCIEIITENLILLEKFYLRRCRKLTNLSSISLSRLNKLKVLDISLCDGMSTDGFLGGIEKNKNSCLEELYIVAIDVCEECIIQISTNLINLRVLDIGHCVNGVTNISVKSISSNLRSLRSLDVEGCPLIDDCAIIGINIISRSPPSQRNTFSPPGSAASLFIDGFYIDPRSQYSEKSPPRMSNSSDQVRSVVPTPPPMPPSIASVVGSSSHSGFKNIQNTDRKKLIKAINELNMSEELHGVQLLKGLQSINLQGCRITDMSLEHGLKFLELRRIILANCEDISVIGIQCLVKNCPATEEIDLSDCNINDQAIQYIAKGFQRLRILNISGCVELTDHSIDSIIVNCKYLQSLSVNRCKNIHVDSEFIITNLPTLRILNIDRFINFGIC